jgi:UDPglucose 6-dehydrogenase
LDKVADYWEQVVLMNDHQKNRFSDNIISTLYNTVSGKKITFLGWAFKKDTNDTRESAAITVADNLLNEHAKISVYDPKVSEEQIFSDLEYLNTRDSEENRALLKVEIDPYSAMKDAHAIAILTEWDEFRSYNWQKVYDQMLKPAFIFDGRRLLDHQMLKSIGFECYEIGTGNASQ